MNGKKLVNLASNDYLGLSQDSRLVQRSIEYTQRYGAGSGASRLLGGNLDVYEKLESKIAELKGTETALILASGFQTNSSVIPALLNEKSVAAADRLVHRSMIEGLLLSKSRWFRYQHNNLHDLQERMNRFHAGERSARWILTESVFSMDGDVIDLPVLVKIAEISDSLLFIDEAHATGVLGENGMGLTAGKKFPGISMGTFGKGLGSFGAYVACSKLLRDYLINFCPGFIYSTGLPPSVLGAIDAALDLVTELSEERTQLQEKAADLRSAITKSGFETGSSSTQIIPLIVGSSISALNLSEYLESCGFYVPAIRPPTVPEGSARLRISLSSVHSKEQLQSFLEALRRWNEQSS
jgi:8-amino-7-oxononanoate synthase